MFMEEKMERSVQDDLSGQLMQTQARCQNQKSQGYSWHFAST